MPRFVLSCGMAYVVYDMLQVTGGDRLNGGVRKGTHYLVDHEVMRFVSSRVIRPSSSNIRTVITDIVTNKDMLLSLVAVWQVIDECS